MIREWILRKVSSDQDGKVAEWCTAAHLAAIHAGYRPIETDVVVLKTVCDCANRQAAQIASLKAADEERYRSGTRNESYNKQAAEWRWLAAECQREAIKLHDMEILANAARCAG